MKKRRWIYFVLSAVLVLVVISSMLSSCATRNVDPTGRRFPTVKARSLSGESRELPGDLAGEPAILIIGYVQGAQFDIDRWIMGLMQVKSTVRILEVPTIDGIVPTLISSWIDSGMKSGIPSEDWPAVVTVYGNEASHIVAATGNEQPRNARVLLIDAEGRVVWFHDRGFSPAQLMALDALARELSNS
ncbi:MAG: hypothetical protein SGI72_10220 [Planctomycetota bacterium]|nr:hypothetical protein [Planctomycetota bacterium]